MGVPLLLFMQLVLAFLDHTMAMVWCACLTHHVTYAKHDQLYSETENTLKQPEGDKQTEVYVIRSNGEHDQATARHKQSSNVLI